MQSHLRQVIVALALVLSCCCDAAEVIWNCFVNEFYPDGKYMSNQPSSDIHYYGHGLSTELNFDYTTNLGGQYTAATIGSMINLGNCLVCWVQATAGDILYAPEDCIGLNVIFNSNPEVDVEKRGGAEIKLNKGTKIFYFALLGADMQGFDPDTGYITRPYWGWVKATASNKTGFIVESSALSFDGPLIVGGGLAPIPEPSSALLVLIGFAWLALRRGRDDSVRIGK